MFLELLFLMVIQMSLKLFANVPRETMENIFQKIQI